MSALVTPHDAVAAVRSRLERRWAEAVCAELGVGDRVVFSVRLRPGVRTGKAVELLSHASWHTWHMQWRDFCRRLPAGAEVVHTSVTIRGVAGGFPAVLHADLDGAATLIAHTHHDAEPPTVDIGRARALASTLRSAGGTLTPADAVTQLLRILKGQDQILGAYNANESV